MEKGTDVLILAIGRTVQEALTARTRLNKEGIRAAVVDCRFVKPLDSQKILALARRIPRIVTAEENMRQGGFGSAVLEALSDAGLHDFALRRVGIGDTFVEHGAPQILRSHHSVNAGAIVRAAQQLSHTEKADTDTEALPTICNLH